MKYLGIPISDVKVGMVAFGELCDKVAKSPHPWKGKHTSSGGGEGGRLILTNTCLSSLSTYTMGFYILPPEAHRRMDTVRSRFFWRGAGGGGAISNTIW
jgi:hypothetical protein